ncbi:hypothetical protein [Sphingomonas aracearum]|uniref:hypothetical protein n=1 Tax=Sphingomonas aracearum TaxID=2283317 RepID=UPI0011C04EE7|nr:hypothetical protein [Sphingomonas aracearum]
MILLAMTIAVALLAALAWCGAAFLLRWRHDARLWATILIPAAIVTIAISIYMGVWTLIRRRPAKKPAGAQCSFWGASCAAASPSSPRCRSGT